MEILIDGDMIHYNVGWSIKDGDVEDAYMKVDSFIKSIIEVVGCSEEDIRLFIAGEGNYRYDILPDYKANRKNKDKPKHHKAIRDYIINVWDAVVVNGQEVDDALGINQTEDSVICSADKDLNCIPGMHYNWSPKYIERGVYSVTEEEANRFFYTQCLSGDSTDNIPGLKKLKGRVATKKIKGVLDELKDRYSMYEYVKGVYGDESWYPSAGALWIRREENQTWQPPMPSNLTESLEPCEDAGQQENEEEI